jgi:cytochrome c oxidase subunit 2
MSNYSPFNPNSPLASATTNLFIFILAIAGFILALVTFLLVYSIIRYRSRGEQGEPPQILGNTKLEIVWTVVPIITLGIVFVYMLQVMGITLPRSAQNPDMIVIGHQWWWEVHYPQSGVVTANELHLPAGKKMLIRLESADVIHDLWLPELGTKMDLVPGKVNAIWLQGDKVGVYYGTCAEFCGTQHAWMRLRAVVETPSDFEAWIKEQQQPAQTPTGSQASQGAQLFQQIACQSCHTIQGTQAQGNVGPDLTHLASRQTLAAGVLDNTPDNLATWLRDPQAVKPGNHMPNLKLSDQQIQQLVAYLETLK